ncbi:hypothetical protein F0562_033793 [Nyssa sinensis]|uniref:Aminotransferase class I/classII large domain-containing protein n=1 Tax=Nyssa sinensis TaxID=561372 RepID=A0A5J5AGU3_9ASTE|nr:hypothetical protein F0562_033793 [Nyssa sinensis]
MKLCLHTFSANTEEQNRFFRGPYKLWPSLLFFPTSFAHSHEGAYSDSRGLPGVTKEVADFIGRRDGYPSDPELIFLTDGASKGVMQILNTIIRDERDGVLVPVPQYPLHSAAIALFGGSLVPYYLEETGKLVPVPHSPLA